MTSKAKTEKTLRSDNTHLYRIEVRNKQTRAIEHHEHVGVTRTQAVTRCKRALGDNYEICSANMIG